MNRFLFLSGIIILLLGCQQNGENSGQSAQQSGETPVQESITPPAGDNALPSVPLETIEMLWEKCDYVDFIFYNLDFSMNQSEQSSIRGTLRHIAETVPAIDRNCKPAGRIFFQVDGKNALQGDFYLSEGCLYFIFYDDGNKAIYANEMTAQGVQFYQNLFTRMLQGQQGGN